MATQPWPIVAKELKGLIESIFPDAAGKVGGDLSYEYGEGLYIHISPLPGSRSDQIYGEWLFDIEFFGDGYTAAMNNALALEALLLDGVHRTPGGFILDTVREESGPQDLPWGDDRVYRIGTTWSFTARRSG